jgi:hypothetical protein
VFRGRTQQNTFRKPWLTIRFASERLAGSRAMKGCGRQTLELYRKSKSRSSGQATYRGLVTLSEGPREDRSAKYFWDRVSRPLFAAAYRIEADQAQRRSKKTRPPPLVGDGGGRSLTPRRRGADRNALRYKRPFSAHLHNASDSKSEICRVAGRKIGKLDRRVPARASRVGNAPSCATWTRQLQRKQYV